mmetsp:Transcript_2893/g.6597  ORF Transcript_2893/g.6597 Transcript_2893/m.6597 type:complete len:200 (-) Transcript_2893:101-700(-)
MTPSTPGRCWCGSRACSSSMTIHPVWTWCTRATVRRRRCSSASTPCVTSSSRPSSTRASRRRASCTGSGCSTHLAPQHTSTSTPHSSTPNTDTKRPPCRRPLPPRMLSMRMTQTARSPPAAAPIDLAAEGAARPPPCRQESPSMPPGCCGTSPMRWTMVRCVCLVCICRGWMHLTSQGTMRRSPLWHCLSAVHACVCVP